MSYEEFRRSIASRIEERLEWKDLATFVPNKRIPVYNWFYYKEGFARDLVFNVLDMFGAKQGAAVLDPFCGSGTVLLACKERGISATGVEAMPVAAFASRVKAQDYGVSMLQSASRNLFAEKFHRIDARFDPLMQRAFSRYALEDIAFFRHLLPVEQPAHDFLLLALVRAAMQCSYARKDGAAIKFVKRPAPPLRPMYRRAIKRMITDVKKFHTKQCAVHMEDGDARMLSLAENSIDFVITSPPYLNQIDYQRVYAIESMIAGLPVVPQKPAQFFHHALATAREPHFEYRGIPMQPSAAQYFADMEKSLAEMLRVLRSGGQAAIVVSNGYAGEIVESDLIIAYIAGQLGFGVKKIFVLNTRFALEERTKKRGLLRESMIVLEK